MLIWAFGLIAIASFHIEWTVGTSPQNNEAVEETNPPPKPKDAKEGRAASSNGTFSSYTVLVDQGQGSIGRFQLSNDLIADFGESKIPLIFVKSATIYTCEHNSLLFFDLYTLYGHAYFALNSNAGKWANHEFEILGRCKDTSMNGIVCYKFSESDDYFKIYEYTKDVCVEQSRKICKTYSPNSKFCNGLDSKQEIPMDTIRREIIKVPKTAKERQIVTDAAKQLSKDNPDESSDRFEKLISKYKFDPAKHKNIITYIYYVGQRHKNREKFKFTNEIFAFADGTKLPLAVINKFVLYKCEHGHSLLLHFYTLYGHAYFALNPDNRKWNNCKFEELKRYKGDLKDGIQYYILDDVSEGSYVYYVIINFCLNLSEKLCEARKCNIKKFEDRIPFYAVWMALVKNPKTSDDIKFLEESAEESNWMRTKNPIFKRPKVEHGRNMVGLSETESKLNPEIYEHVRSYTYFVDQKYKQIGRYRFSSHLFMFEDNTALPLILVNSYTVYTCRHGVPFVIAFLTIYGHLFCSFNLKTKKWFICEFSVLERYKGKYKNGIQYYNISERQDYAVMYYVIMSHYHSSFMKKKFMRKKSSCILKKCDQKTGLAVIVEASKKPETYEAREPFTNAKEEIDSKLSKAPQPTSKTASTNKNYTLGPDVYKNIMSSAHFVNHMNKGIGEFKFTNEIFAFADGTKLPLILINSFAIYACPHAVPLLIDFSTIYGHAYYSLDLDTGKWNGHQFEEFEVYKASFKNGIQYYKFKEKSQYMHIHYTVMTYCSEISKKLCIGEEEGEKICETAKYNRGKGINIIRKLVKRPKTADEIKMTLEISQEMNVAEPESQEKETQEVEVGRALNVETTVEHVQEAVKEEPKEIIIVEEPVETPESKEAGLKENIEEQQVEVHPEDQTAPKDEEVGGGNLGSHSGEQQSSSTDKEEDTLKSDQTKEDVEGIVYEVKGRIPYITPRLRPAYPLPEASDQIYENYDTLFPYYSYTFANEDQLLLQHPNRIERIEFNDHELVFDDYKTALPSEHIASLDVMACIHNKPILINIKSESRNYFYSIDIDTGKWIGYSIDSLKEFEEVDKNGIKCCNFNKSNDVKLAYRAFKDVCSELSDRLCNYYCEDVKPISPFVLTMPDFKISIILNQSQEESNQTITSYEKTAEISSKGC